MWCLSYVCKWYCSFAVLCSAVLFTKTNPFCTYTKYTPFPRLNACCSPSPFFSISLVVRRSRFLLTGNESERRRDGMETLQTNIWVMAIAKRITCFGCFLCSSAATAWEPLLPTWWIPYICASRERSTSLSFFYMANRNGNRISAVSMCRITMPLYDTDFTDNRVQHLDNIYILYIFFELTARSMLRQSHKHIHH